MKPLAELRLLIARHARADRSDTALDGVRVIASSVPGFAVHGVSEPAFAVVAQGTKKTLLGGRSFVYGAGDYVVTTVDLPITSFVMQASAARPYMAAGMILRPDAIATLALEAAASERVTVAPPGMAVARATDDLLEALVRLLRLLDRPQDRKVLGPSIEREILWRLLAGEEGARVRQIGLADSRLSQVAHAIRWIRGHYAEMLRIEELAHLAAMSVSSFHRHFRAVTAMTPLNYQKRIRLQEARARLLAEPGGVAAVGFAVGYQSPSQFSREYSRLFGASPARDMANLRSVPASRRGIA